MIRKAFLLGLFSIGGQVLILRELVVSFNGHELFIGTALFGWLIAVAIGAILGGRSNKLLKAKLLFFAGSLILPFSIIGTRMITLMFTENVGEIVPFAVAAVLSIVLTFPTGFISGFLFPLISSQGYRPSASLNKVYLFEGIGAFTGGIIVTALVGPLFSNLAMAIGLGLMVLIFSFANLRGKNLIVVIIVSSILLLAVRQYSPLLDRYLDGIKYKPFNIVSTFDTHYGRQTIISRDRSTVLLTDNKIEGSYPDLETAENCLIPPLIYRPEAKNILIIGRAEFSAGQIISEFPDIKFSAIDPRESLGRKLKDLIPLGKNVINIVDDPIAYVNNFEAITKFDIIILLAGEPDNYKNARLLSGSFLIALKRKLTNDGILYIPTQYDTDRFISSEKSVVLSIIYGTLKSTYKYVHIWPGTRSLFFVADNPLFEITYAEILERINRLHYRPQYISENYLSDRLDGFKLDQLKSSISDQSILNSLDTPSLVYFQTKLTAATNKLDASITDFIYDNLLTFLFIPFVIIIFFIYSVLCRRKRRIYSLFLYFLAGLFSLSAELVTFYLYQSKVGSLYSELGLLIGTFMLGLALGTLAAIKSGSERLEFPALLLMLTSIILFFATYTLIPNTMLLYYFVLFLLTIALGCGSLFVAATHRFYFGRVGSNQGLGYAFEIFGSSLGALFTITILLPFIGVHWLLISMTILLLFGLIGAYITE